MNDFTDGYIVFSYGQEKKLSNIEGTLWSAVVTIPSPYNTEIIYWFRKDGIRDSVVTRGFYFIGPTTISNTWNISNTV